MTTTKKTTAAAEERFDDLLKRLEGLVGQLERGDLALEDALKAFEEGVGLVRRGQARLDDMDRRVEMLLTDGTTRPLPPGPDAQDPDDGGEPPF